MGHEVLHDDHGVLGDGVLVGEREPGEQAVGFGGVDLLLVRVLVHQLPVGVVRDVVAQRVEDEAFLDGLAHGVRVEGAVDRLAVLGDTAVLGAEEFEGLRLGGGREGEVGEIGGLGALDGFRLELVVHGDGGRARVLGVGVQAEVPQGGLHGGGGVAGLGGVRLVDDYGEAGALDVCGVALDVVEEGRERVQGDRDDLAGVA